MEWKEWIGKKVFVKLTDGQIFSNSEVLAYEEPFLSLTDKFGYPAVINTRSIMKIKEEENKDGKKENSR